MTFPRARTAPAGDAATGAPGPTPAESTGRRDAEAPEHRAGPRATPGVPGHGVVDRPSAFPGPVAASGSDPAPPPCPVLPAGPRPSRPAGPARADATAPPAARARPRRPAPYRPTPGRLLTGTGLLLALLLGAGFLWFAEVAGREGGPLPAVDGIAILTGGPDRVETGLRLALDRPDAPLIVSGVGPDADLMALARLAGLEPWPLLGRIAIGRQARSTRDNAAEVALWARQNRLRSIAVVTAGFHLPRALLELRRALPGVTLHPVPVEPFRARPPAMAREYAKLIGAWLGLSAPTPGLGLPPRQPGPGE